MNDNNNQNDNRSTFTSKKKNKNTTTSNSRNTSSSRQRQGRGRGQGRDPQKQKQFQSRTKNTTDYISGSNNNNINSNNININNNTKTKTNGEKGAEAYTVSEVDRIQFTQMLIQFRESGNANDTMEMSKDLTNTERKFLHMLAMQLGLKSKSSGKGENRKITITKPADTTKTKANDAYDLPLLRIGQLGREQLVNHITIYPPSEQELKESYQTGSSLLDINQHCSGIDVDDVDDDILLAFPHSNTHKNVDKSSTISTHHHHHDNNHHTRVKQIDLSKRITYHHQAQHAKSHNTQYLSMLQQRATLPAFAYREEICEIIQSNAITLISGDTGCGKSTQIPQFILDDPIMGPTCNIVVTQPRRISAISIAERVASERCESVGQTVGYNIRLETNYSPDRTQLLFVTPGILLRKFQSSPDLQEFTHVIIDEIHERDRYTEFLMIALRDLMKRRPHNLRIILMSATIQTNELLDYWSGIGTGLQSNVNVESSHFTTCDNVSADVMQNPLILTGKSTLDVAAPIFTPSSNFISNISVTPNHSNTILKDKPAEVNIPGRTYPVQEFFLEDVLTMTNYVNQDNFASSNNQLEADLETLLQSKYSNTTSSKGVNRGGCNDKSNIDKKSQLFCIICNKVGFQCPEELGSHLALCDGGGSYSTLELENRVRDFDGSQVSSYDNYVNLDTDCKTTEGNNDTESVESYDEAVDDTCDDSGEENDEDQKWDGVSPFILGNSIANGLSTTFTEEQMLDRYQTMHNDDQIDYDLLLDIIKYIDQSSYGDGAILVFLPGWQEISEFSTLLESTPPFYDQSQFQILPLHSGISSMDQRKVFQKTRFGRRKIILSTNIAETSVTIDDVAFVVDSGKAKEKSYDPHLKTSTLQPVWISQASAKQRKGRAGRTKAGVCFHLFSKRRHASLRPFLESEILRTPLEELCLTCKKLNLAPGGPDDDDGIPAFLASALSPPHPKSVMNAIDLLVDIGAMDRETNELTDLGNCLSVLSLEPRVGKMMIWSYLLGCAKAASSMAVAMSYKSPFNITAFSMRRNADKAKVEISNGTESDQMTVMNVLNYRDQLLRRNKSSSFQHYCRSNFINVASITMIANLRKNLANELTSLGFPDPSHPSNGWHNRNSYGNNIPFLQGAVAAGLYPNIAMRSDGEANFKTMNNRKAKIHMSSVNACQGMPLSRKCLASKGDIELIAFGELTKGISSFTMSQTSHLASLMPIILLCGQLSVCPAYNDPSSEEAVLAIDDWIFCRCPKDSASSLVILRNRLNRIFCKVVARPREGLNVLNDEERHAISSLEIVLNSSFNASPGRVV